MATSGRGFAGTSPRGWLITALLGWALALPSAWADLGPGRGFSPVPVLEPAAVPTPQVAPAPPAPVLEVEVEEPPAPAGPVTDGPREVIVARLEDKPIVSATERFILSRLDEAEQRGAPFVLLLNTPGGAVDNTRAIVSRFLDARVPVVVYVAPAGSRAGSAGVFLTMAGHVAAMAPGTNIGAAHPVGLGVGAPAQEEEPEQDGTPPPDGARGRASRSEEEVMAQKVENDLVAFAEAIAIARKRNVEWAIDAVRNSASVPAERALELSVVDLLTPSLEELLGAIDGRVVETKAGLFRINSAGAQVEERPMTTRETVQTWLGDPSVAYTLASLGVLGIVLELYNPGMMIGAIFGGICLVLAAASGLPFSAAGLLLLAAAGVLFTLEVYITSFGLLAIAGTVCLALGGLFLFESPSVPSGVEGFSLEVGYGVIASMSLFTLALTAVFGVMIGKALRRKPQTGMEAVVGTEAVVTQDFIDGRGKVEMRGELWNAQCDKGAPTRGARVRVVGNEGLLLKVETLPGRSGSKGR